MANGMLWFLLYVLFQQITPFRKGKSLELQNHTYYERQLEKERRLGKTCLQFSHPEQAAAKNHAENQ